MLLQDGDSPVLNLFARGMKGSAGEVPLIEMIKTIAFEEHHSPVRFWKCQKQRPGVTAKGRSFSQGEQCAHILICRFSGTLRNA